MAHCVRPDTPSDQGVPFCLYLESAEFLFNSVRWYIVLNAVKVDRGVEREIVGHIHLFRVS